MFIPDPSHLHPFCLPPWQKGAASTAVPPHTVCQKWRNCPWKAAGHGDCQSSMCYLRLLSIHKESRCRNQLKSHFTVGLCSKKAHPSSIYFHRKTPRKTSAPRHFRHLHAMFLDESWILLVDVVQLIETCLCLFLVFIQLVGFGSRGRLKAWVGKLLEITLFLLGFLGYCMQHEFTDGSCYRGYVSFQDLITSPYCTYFRCLLGGGPGNVSPSDTSWHIIYYSTIGLYKQLGDPQFFVVRYPYFS